MAKLSSKKDSLCICLTPLHVLIAEKVSETTGHSFDKGIYFSYHFDAKTEHYFNKMASFCKETEFVLLPNDAIKSKLKHFKILIQRWAFKFKYKYLSGFEQVFIPTSSNLYLLLLLPSFKNSRIISFDDGIVNIAYDNIHLKQEREKSLASRLFKRLSGIHSTLDSLISSSERHYTIYPKSRNISSNTINIGLSRQVVNVADTNDLIKIFIGPPPEANKDIWEKVNQKIIELKPQEFLPHPRDVHQMAKNVMYSSTNLIAEDYIVNLLEKNPKAFIEIFGLQSSALIHLAQLPSVKVYSFIDNNSDNAFLRALLADYGVGFIKD